MYVFSLTLTKPNSQIKQVLLIAIILGIKVDKILIFLSKYIDKIDY